MSLKSGVHIQAVLKLTSSLKTLYSSWCFAGPVKGTASKYLITTSLTMHGEREPLRRGNSFVLFASRVLLQCRPSMALDNPLSICIYFSSGWQDSPVSTKWIPQCMPMVSLPSEPFAEVGVEVGAVIGSCRDLWLWCRQILNVIYWAQAEISLCLESSPYSKKKKPKKQKNMKYPIFLSFSPAMNSVNKPSTLKMFSGIVQPSHLLWGIL